MYICWHAQALAIVIIAVRTLKIAAVCLRIQTCVHARQALSCGLYTARLIISFKGIPTLPKKKVDEIENKIANTLQVT